MTHDAVEHEVSPQSRTALQVGPALLLAATAIGFAFPPTRAAAKWVFYDENGPVELLTFALAILGCVGGFSIAARARELRLGLAAVAFYCAFAAGLLFVGMEEVAWGQWFFHWQTPDSWREINSQGETTLHNLEMIQGSTEIFRVVFAVGGLVGVGCARLPAMATVFAPALLAPLFWLIGAHAGVDLALDYVAPGGLAEKAFTRTSEIVEMYVGLAGWLYVMMNSRRLARRAGVLRSSSGVAAPSTVPLARLDIIRR